MRKVAVITGASRGIGEACAVAFAKAGYDLALCCKSSFSALERQCEQYKSEYGVSAIAFEGSVADSCFVDTMIRRVLERFDRIDVLVNNAGISKVGLLQDMSDEDWREILDINLSSIFYFSRQVIPTMVRQHYGHIINISSVWGVVGASCEVAYSATKGGVNAMTCALAKELAPSHIAVNALACGAVDTSMNGHLSEDELEELAEEIPFGRFARPEEVAEMVLSLATAPTYMTGQVINFDGGWQ